MEGEHRLKERIELSLDNRQIFFLFVVSAAVVSVVFALGVVVGKRLGSPAAPAPVPTDPLAMLDQLGQLGSEPPDDELTFHEALTEASRDKRKKQEQRPAGAKLAAKGEKPSPPPKKPAADEKKKPPRAVEEQQASAKPAKVGSEARSQASEAEPGSGGLPGAAVAAAGKPSRSADPVGRKRPGAAAKPARPSRAAEPEVADQPVAKGGYTLQLSSFQDREEAERFMQRLRSKGLQPHITPARIPDRGVWYRVRVGNYKSWEEALAAKAKVERSEQVIAYVARIGS